MKPISLDRLLQSQGMGTRAYCREVIENGELSIDGQCVIDWKTKVDPEAHQFKLFDEPFDYHEFVYIALNKPAGYECSRRPTRHLGVLTLLPERFLWRDVQPVGRLDHDTTGLLLLSDDGQFIHRMSSPKHELTKTYRVTTHAPIDEALLRALREGVQLKDETSPLAAVFAEPVDDHHLDLGLTEGKYHQVKRMIAAAGHHCEQLERIAIGPLELAHMALPVGEWRHLSAAEMASLHP